MMQPWCRRRTRFRYICIYTNFYSAFVWVEDMLMSVMFITAQRQIQSKNLRLVEGNPFTSLPLGLTVGCLIQDIDSNHSCPKITYWFTLLTVVSWKLNHCDLHCHIKYIVVRCRLVVLPLCQSCYCRYTANTINQYLQDRSLLLVMEETLN